MSCCARGSPKEAPRIYLSMSRGVCRECKEMIAVRYVADDHGVYLERTCPTHGVARSLVAETLGWYLDALQAPIAAKPPRAVLMQRTGECAESCGPCQFHAQRCNLPVFSITNACNLRCPICFTYNREDATYFMAPDEFEDHVDFVVKATGGVDLINITGGEPTLHPDLFLLLEKARRPEIGRVTINTNGLTLARNPDMASRLAESGAYAILSLDTLNPETSVRLHGSDITEEKLRALDNLEKFGVPTTILMVLVAGVNEAELKDVLEIAMRRPFVRSLTIQTMTYTGQGGGAFLPRRHIPIETVERLIEEATSGGIRKADFSPLPTAHPLCYGVNYLLLDEEGRPHSFSEMLGKEAIARHLADGYLMQPSEELEQDLRLAIDRLWSEERSPAVLDALKHMLKVLFPSTSRLTVHERQRLAEKMVKTIYVHAHMDEDTYEVGRAVRCPDQVPVHAKRLIGACNYNLFYRMKDERFWVANE